MTLAESPASAARRFAVRKSGSVRIAGPASQNPTMAPKVFWIRSSTSNKRYGCS